MKLLIHIDKQALFAENSTDVLPCVFKYIAWLKNKSVEEGLEYAFILRSYEAWDVFSAELLAQCLGVDNLTRAAFDGSDYSQRLSDNKSLTIDDAISVYQHWCKEMQSVLVNDDKTNWLACNQEWKFSRPFPFSVGKGSDVLSIFFDPTLGKMGEGKSSLSPFDTEISVLIPIGDKKVKDFVHAVDLNAVLTSPTFFIDKTKQSIQQYLARLNPQGEPVIEGGEQEQTDFEKQIARMRTFFDEPVSSEKHDTQTVGLSLLAEGAKRIINGDFQDVPLGEEKPTPEGEPCQRKGSKFKKSFRKLNLTKTKSNTFGLK